VSIPVCRKQAVGGRSNSLARFRRSPLAGFLLLSALGRALAAEPVTWVCPDRVPAVRVSVAEVPEGWTLQSTDRSLLLTGDMVFDGPPEEGAALKPQWTSADGRREAWSLESLVAPAWVSCEYGGGAIRLIRPVPPGLSWCEPREVKQSRPPRLQISMHCSNTPPTDARGMDSPRSRGSNAR
jgi:hypothetical protein